MSPSRSFDSPEWIQTFQSIAHIANQLGLAPLYMDPETFPPPRKIYTDGDHISRLVEKYGINIQPSEFNKWRPLSKAEGTHVSLPGVFWILCTDGNLAWVLTSDHKTTMLIQLDNFVGPKEYWIVEEKVTRERKQQDKVNSLLDDLLDL